MNFRTVLLSFKQIVFCSTLLASNVSAQTQPPINVFFGFEFVLQPIAVKWSCGGQSDRDLSQIAALIAAFPEDAQSADLQSIVDDLLDASEREAGLAEILGAELSIEQLEKLCAAALPLNIDWVTPEQLADGEEDDGSIEQRAAWEEYYKVVEELQ